MRRWPAAVLLIALGLLGACDTLWRETKPVEVAPPPPPSPASIAETRYRQGLRYLNGDGVAADPARAIEEFRAAAREIPDAAFLIGLAYRSGRGVARDDDVAVTWFRQAADRGHAEAQ